MRLVRKDESSRMATSGCFHSLLLETCPYLCLAKALVPELQPTNSGDARYRRAHLHNSGLHLSSTNN